MNGERISCLVPFCNRTHKSFPSPEVEWICQKHWAMTSRSTRRFFFLAKRRQRWKTYDQIWNKLKKQAIERSLGI